MLNRFNDVGLPFDITMYRRAEGSLFARKPYPQFRHNVYWYVSVSMLGFSVNIYDNNVLHVTLNIFNIVRYNNIEQRC